MRIGVTISRDWDDYEAIDKALTAAIEHVPIERKLTLVHGASQMDWFVAGLAHTLGMTLEAHPADWQTYGKMAGPYRNDQMVASGADVWLAFIKNHSRGASDCARKAEAAGIPVRRYER